MFELLTNREALIALMESWGPLAPVLYILLQIIQTIVAPIPGQVVGGLGGYLFGPLGIIWTLIGTLVGCYCVFRLTRRFGRPLLERLFKPALVEKFDFIINAPGAAVVLFIIFLLPAFPDDLICYIAGLTKLSIRRLMLLVLFGRLPVIILTNFLGDQLTSNLPLVLAVCGLSIALFGLVLWQRERLMTLLHKLAKKRP